MPNYDPIIRKIDYKIKIRCWEYLKHNNLANRGIYDGDKSKQFIGLLGELETHDLLKGYYPNLDKKQNGFDGGVDIRYNNKTIDVKTMGRNFYTKPNWVNNFAKIQEHYVCDILLFNSINKKTNCIEFCGWIWKDELKTKGKLYREGTTRNRGRGKMLLITDNYEIKNIDLRNIRGIIQHG
tara:strand:- start:16595 stop:17137 length:543 start_codon:yes stop_codon:yes gene_type:complete